MERRIKVKEFWAKLSQIQKLSLKSVLQQRWARNAMSSALTSAIAENLMGYRPTCESCIA